MTVKQADLHDQVDTCSSQSIPAVIAIFVPEYDLGIIEAVEGLSAYRRRHRLDWDIRLVTEREYTHIPPHAYWVVPAQGYLDDIPKLQRQQAVISFTGKADRFSRPCCRFDELACGRLAARHLHERGYRIFATVACGLHDQFQQRGQGFVDEVKSLGGQIYQLGLGGLGPRAINASFLKQVRALPKPIGLYCFTDDQASAIRDQVLDGGLRIPEDLAVVGTGNCYRQCHARQPFLSSVDIPWAIIGREAGHMLHHQIQGNGQSVRRCIRPYRVIARASTQAVTPGDSLVDQAIKWLRDNLDSATPLETMSQFLNTASPTVTRRFKECLGITPKKALDRIRIEHACRLLADTRMSISEIARHCGFTGSTPFGVAFKRLRHCTPSNYRSTVKSEQSCKGL